MSAEAAGFETDSSEDEAPAAVEGPGCDVGDTPTVNFVCVATAATDPKPEGPATTVPDPEGLASVAPVPGGPAPTVHGPEGPAEVDA